MIRCGGAGHRAAAGASTGDRSVVNIVLIELIVVVVIALGLGFWQLWDVNRELRKDRERGDEPRESDDTRDDDNGRR